MVKFSADSSLNTWGMIYLFFVTQSNGFTSNVHRKTTRLYLDGEGMAGKTFNKHLLGDVLRALQPRYLDQVKSTISDNLKGSRTMDIDLLLDFCDKDGNGPPSWDELQVRLLSQQNGKEKNFRSRLEEGLEHSPLATSRVFAKNEKPMVTLYRDAAAWCPYCQKVWISLEEKQIPYNVVKVDMNCYAGSSKPGDFLQVQPSGSLPCAVINGGNYENMAIAQSDDILKILDGLNESKLVPTLLPTEDVGLEYMKFLCEDGRNSLERRLYGEWMWYLTGKRKPVEYRERYEAVLTEVETELSRFSGPFFMGGKVPNIVDIKFIPFLERQEASLLYYKGYVVRDKLKFPNLCKWFDGMESRQSYLMTKSDIYTHTRALPPQLGGTGCSFADGHEEMKEAIDAYCTPTDVALDITEESIKWREEGWGNVHGKDEKKARREAVERIIFNNGNICKFAARGAGTAGFPPASAELADPKATPNDLAKESVDIFLRYTVGLLLANDDMTKNKLLESLEKACGSMTQVGESGDISTSESTVKATIDCLDYLRARIGAPRDMTYPAAYELRKELLQVSSTLMKGRMSENRYIDSLTTSNV